MPFRRGVTTTINLPERGERLADLTRGVRERVRFGSGALSSLVIERQAGAGGDRRGE